MAWYRGVARAAAERRLVVDFHGSTAPRGLARTWPNVLTSEAVLGAESYKGDDAADARAQHHLPFTRNAIGAMDYTPVTFSAPGRPDERGARAGALGRVRVRAAALRRQPRAPTRRGRRGRAGCADVPAAWDDTRLLGGLPGRRGDDRAPRRADAGTSARSRPARPGRGRLPLGFLVPRPRATWRGSSRTRPAAGCAAQHAARDRRRALRLHVAARAATWCASAVRPRR